MKKKVLGDDPFRPKDASPPKKPSAPVNKTKRAPSRKTEAPKAAKKPAAKPRTVPVAAAVPISAAIPVSAAVPVSSAMLAPSDEPPLDAAPGSWRWWRFRQTQLARAEEAAFLAKSDPNADRFGRDPALAGRAEPIVDFVYRSLLRVTVRGLGHVPDSGQAILVARRRTAQADGLYGLALAQLERLGLASTFAATLDAALIAHAVRTEHVAHRSLRPLVRPARFYTPLLGSLLRRLGGVPADVHDLARLLDEDRLALALTGAQRGQSTLDLSTIVCIALVTGAPIVPVKITSTARRLTKNGSTTLDFATPLYLGTEFGAEGAEDEALVARLAGEIDAQL